MKKLIWPWYIAAIFGGLIIGNTMDWPLSIFVAGFFGVCLVLIRQNIES